jgi:ADP-Ribosyltransferase in polyvalent proteins
MPVYQYEDQHYDLPDGLTNEQAIAKIEAHLGKTKSDEPSLLDKATGVGQAAASLISGAAAMPAGFLAGVMQKANDPSNVDFEKQVASNIDRYTYEPSRELGKEYAGKVGQVLNDVGIPALAHLGGVHLPTTGNIATQIKSKKSTVPSTLGAFKAIDELGKQELKGQGELFPETLSDTTGHASPIVPPNFEPTTPLRQRRQMELQLERPETVNIDNAGVSLRPEDMKAVEAAKEAELARLDEQARQQGNQDFLQAKQGEVFEPQTNMHRDYTDQRVADANGGERPLTRAEFDKTLENLTKEEGTRFQAPEDKAAAYQQYLDHLNENQPGLFDIGSRTEGWKEQNYQNSVPRMVDEHPFVKNAEKKLAKQEAFIESLREQVANGESRATVLVGEMRALKDAQEKVAVIRANVTEALQKKEVPKPLNVGKFSRQRGAIDPSVFLGKFPDFAASKFKDAMGKLMVMYHGTSKDVPFKDIKANKTGIWVTDNPTDASSYAMENDSMGYTRDGWKLTPKNTASRVMPVYVNAKNLYKLTPEDRAKYKTANNYTKIQTELTERAKALGYDGINWEGGVYTVFSADQVKSALSPLNSGKFSKQKGAILNPFDFITKDKNPEKFKENMWGWLPEQRPVEQIISDSIRDKVPDVNQNFLQRAANHFTKGSRYQAIKTNNPIIRYASDLITRADQQIKLATGNMIHEILAPASRAMNTSERTAIAALMQHAEKNSVKLTPEFLAEHGYSEAQIKYVEAQKAMAADAARRINETQALAGEPPITLRTSYIATRFSGDFRRLITKDDKVVGVIGANTKWQLDNLVKQLQEKHPEYTLGNEQFYGGTKANKNAGFAEMLNYLSGKDPSIKEFYERVNNLLSDDAYDYLNAKTHTMEKKGVFGSEGNKLFTSAKENAEAMIEAQQRYYESIVRWSEMNKAVEKLKPLLKEDNGLEMPKAKQWTREYLEGALGNNPSELGRAVDNIFSTLGKVSGVGTTIPSHILSSAKRLVNGLLLGHLNIPFMGMNIMQPARVMPEMAAYLKSKGAEVGWDIGMGRSLMTMQKEAMKKPLDALETDALKYAKDNHVYSSNLLETGNSIKKGGEYAWDYGTQWGVGQIEAQTRKSVYLSFVNILDASGIKRSEGLFEAAHNLTDSAMNNYAQSEAPRAFQEMGSLGRASYNLVGYKHNELSRLVMLAREIPNNATFSPLLVAMASQMFWAGLKGTVIYHEADWFVRKISELMGKPTSITKMLLDHPEISDKWKYGVPGQAVGADISSRMGLQVAPSSLGDALFPGGSKLVDIGKAAGKLATDRTEYDAKNLVRELAPNSANGLIDRAWFSQPMADGKELAINRNKIAGDIVRDTTGQRLKNFGLTGINESKQKENNYETDRISRWYDDARGSALKQAAKVFYTSGKIPSDFAQNYIKLQGDPTKLEKDIMQMAIEQKVPVETLKNMQDAMSTSLTSKYRLQRRTEAVK